MPAFRCCCWLIDTRAVISYDDIAACHFAAFFAAAAILPFIIFSPDIIITLFYFADIFFHVPRYFRYYCRWLLPLFDYFDTLYFSFAVCFEDADADTSLRYFLSLWRHDIFHAVAITFSFHLFDYYYADWCLHWLLFFFHFRPPCCWCYDCCAIFFWCRAISSFIAILLIIIFLHFRWYLIFLLFHWWWCRDISRFLWWFLPLWWRWHWWFIYLRLFSFRLHEYFLSFHTILFHCLLMIISFIFFFIFITLWYAIISLLLFTTMPDFR